MAPAFGRIAALHATPHRELVTKRHARSRLPLKTPVHYRADPHVADRAEPEGSILFLHWSERINKSRVLDNKQRAEAY